MTHTKPAARKTLSVRPATSRKLLARKAAEQAPATADQSEALEACFPAEAEPGDKGWCTGYVGGAIRQGALALAEVSAPSADGAVDAGASTHVDNVMAVAA